MTHRRRVPSIERHILNARVETFFDMLIPPGVSPEKTHIFVAAHLGEPLARQLEGEIDGAGEADKTEGGNAGPKHP